MGIKSLFIFLVLALILHGKVCLASPVSGLYKGPNQWIVKLVEDKSSKYKIAYGDIAERSTNRANKKISICLTFEFLDILIPKDLAVGLQAECFGSSVRVDKHLPDVSFGNTKFKNVYLLTVSRSGTVNVGGGVKKVPGGKKTFELLYSKNSGLIGFRELPSNREDFFLIDWRSLEERRKTDNK